MAMDMNAALKITASVNGGSAIDQLKASMDRLDASSSGVAKGFGLLKTAVAGFIGVQAIQAVAGFAKSSIDAADQLSKMSQKTGVAVQTLGELKYAGDLAGTSIEQIQSAMTKLSVKATEAATGSKTAGAAFEALGISVTNTNGGMKSQIQLLEESAKAIASISDPTVKAAMAVELFGKSGAELIPLLDTMEESRREAREMGIVFGEDFARSSEQFNDNITRMQSLLSGLTVQILNSVIPGVNRLVERMISAGKESRSFFGAIQGGAHQLILEAGTDFKNLDAEIVRVQQKLSRLEEMRRDLTKPSIANSINNFISNDVAIVNDQINMAKEQLKQLRAAKDAAVKASPAAGGVPTAGRGGETDPLKRLNAIKAAEEEAKKAAAAAATQEKQREAILQGLNDKVVTLTQSEAALTIVKLRRLGASEKEIESARRLLSVTAIAEAGAETAKQAEEALEAKQRERKSTLAALRDEVLKLKEGEDALTVSKMQALGATKEEIAQLVELQKQQAGLIAAKEQEKQAAKDLKEESDAVARGMQEIADQGKRVFDQTRTPAEKLAIEIERISQLLESGAIDWDTYNRAIKGAQNEFAGLGKSSTDMFSNLEKTIQGWGKSSADAIVDFALTGKMSFGDMTSSIISDMLKMIVYQQIMKPIFDMLGAAAGNFMSGGGGGSFGIPMPTMAAKGMAFDGVERFATGGVFSTATPFMFASGGMMRNGVMGEAGPEAIMPLKRGADGNLGVASAGGSATSVVVNNYGNSQASTQETMDSRGNRRIEVTIGELVANEVRRPGSSAHSSVRDTFGARPALVGR